MRRLIRSFGTLAIVVGPVSLSCAGALNEATDDAALESLILSAGILSREFTGDHLSYAVTVPQGIGTFTLTATPRVRVSRLEVRQDDGEPIRLQSGVASPALNVPGVGGWSSVMVRVVAADGVTTWEYGLLVTQAAPSGAARGGFVIYSIGDSTMADHDTAASPSQRGWAQLFSQLVVGADVTFVNAAKKGSSSKSFIVDGSWESVRSKLAPGDYVFIQFAHGDEADNGLDGDGGIGTAPFGAYQVYLRRYIDEARAAGATPILFAPVVRGTFSGTSLSPASCHDLTGAGDASIPVTQNLSYVEAMKQVGAAKQCPVVDLTASTKLLVEQLGAAFAQAVVYVGADGTDSTDSTNLQPNGATLFAGLAAEELIAQGILVEHLRVSTVLVVSPLVLDFGTVSVGSTSDKTVSVTGLSLRPDAGNVTVTAPEGFEVSTTATGAFGSSVRLSALGTRLSPTSLSVRFKPTAGQAYSGTIAVVLDSGETKSIAVGGSGLSVAASATETSVFYSLTADTSCSTAGPATCSAERFSSLYVKNYQMPSLTSTTWVPSAPPLTTTQRLTVTGDVWPSSETSLVSSRYVEFAMSPAGGKTWEVDMLSLRVGASGGNSLAYRIQYSKQANFGGPSPLLDSPTNANNTMVLQLFTFTPGITLFPGESLQVRIFPWYRGLSGSGKSLCLQGLAVHGWAR